MSKKNLRSDAALERFKQVALASRSATIASVGETKNDVIVHLAAKNRDADEWCEAEISINATISKRKSLRGINARLKAAVRKSSEK